MAVQIIHGSFSRWLNLARAWMKKSNLNIKIKFGALSTVCTRSSDPFKKSKLLYKMGHYFLDIQYVYMKYMYSLMVYGLTAYIRLSVTGLIYINPVSVNHLLKEQ